MSFNERAETYVPEDAPRFHSMQVMPAMAPMPMMPSRRSVAEKRPMQSAARKSNKPPPTSGWTVGQLAPLPPIYILERTHVHVDDQPQNVASRVAGCLQKESIAATFHTEVAMLDAETDCSTQFTVRLWSGKNGQVLIEVQKVSGCCYTFCQAAKAVLRAAKGMNAPAKRRTFSIPPCIPKMDAEESEAATLESLEIAGNLLKQKQMDAQLMAIESLNALSKAPESECLAARSILSGEFRKTILDLVQSDRHCDSLDRLDGAEKEHVKLMHRYALTTLANCLAVLEKSGELSRLLEQQEELLSRDILMSLMDEVAAASERPHEALQAVKCLRTLLSAAPADTRRIALDMGAFEVVSQASKMGACRSAALGNECTKLQELL